MYECMYVRTVYMLAVSVHAKGETGVETGDMVLFDLRIDIDCVPFSSVYIYGVFAGKKWRKENPE